MITWKRSAIRSLSASVPGTLAKPTGREASRRRVSATGEAAPVDLHAADPHGERVGIDGLIIIAPQLHRQLVRVALPRAPRANVGNGELSGVALGERDPR